MKRTPSNPPPLNEEVTPVLGWRRTFASLEHPLYRAFFLGQTVSMTGTWMRTAALAWLTYQLTGSEFQLGLLFVLRSLPSLLFSTWAGSLADRFSKVRIFALTTWFSMAASAALTVLLFLGHLKPGLLLGFAPLWGLAHAFELPARQALVPSLVDRRLVVNAIALNSAVVNGARVVGPALGGLLLAAFGPAWCFLIDTLSYTAVLFALARLKKAGLGNAPSTEGRRRPLSALSPFLRSHRKTATTLMALTVMSLCAWPYMSQMAAFAQVQIGLDAKGYGWFLAMNGLGACAAGLTVATLGDHGNKFRQLVLGILIFGLSIVLLGFQHHPIGAAFFVFFVGFGIILFFSTSNSYLQTQVPDALRGRLMGVWALIFGGGLPIGSLGLGALASRVGSGVALQTAGAICLGLFGVLYVSERRPKTRSHTGGRPFASRTLLW